MLQPKRTKYRKMHKMKIRGKATRGTQLSFGSFGIKAIEECWMTGKQIEAARVAMTRFLKREGQVWIRVFLISRLPINLQRFVWVKEKVHLNIG